LQGSRVSHTSATLAGERVGVTRMKNPNTSPQPAQGQGLDPLEELARIMNDTKTPNPNKPSNDATAAQDDPLDLGLGDHGLAELFGDQGFDDDPVLSTSFEAELQSAANEPADELLKDLDFSAIDLPGLDDPAPVPDGGEGAPMPSLTDHLTPRPQPQSAWASARQAHGQEPAAHQAVQEDDLLAAMDALALDEPTQMPGAPAAAVPPPLHQSESPLTSYSPAVEAGDEGFGQGDRDQGVAFDGAPDDQPGFAEFDQSDVENERSGAGKMVLFALAGIAVLGIGGVIAFGLISGNGADGSAPQVIAAAEGDDKVEPVATEEAQSRPGDAVFSRLDEGDAAGASTPRVVLPQSANDGLPLQSTERLPSADIAPAAPGSTASRAVRTVTVRADGTVVESTTPPSGPAQDVQIEAANARPVEVVSVSPAGVSVNTQPIAEAVSAAQTAAESAAQIALQNAAQSALEEATQAAASSAPPVPVARPATAPTQIQPTQIQPVPVAPAQTPAQSSTPIQLATPATAPAQAVTPQPVVAQPAVTQPLTPTPAATQPAIPASVATGDFIVQLASLRSEEEARATFDRLQNRFGSILSGFGPNIQRADLGDRGIYHRVRIGPMDRAAADSLCQRYQSAGGECFVQRQ
jgi:hypothetical protein